MKPTYSKITPKLGKYRRTVQKYYLNGVPEAKRKKRSVIDEFYDIIQHLLSEDTPQQFFYKRVLWQYLIENHGLQISYSTFRLYIFKTKEFQAYFDENKKSPSTTETIRYKTSPAEQVQLDWKENVRMLLADGIQVTFNVLLLTLSFSRYKFAKVTFDKTQDALVGFFEEMDGVPSTILTDNMKTIMLEPRISGSSGKIHPNMLELSKNFNFTFKPCMARRPQTKGKVES